MTLVSQNPARYPDKLNLAITCLSAIPNITARSTHTIPMRHSSKTKASSGTSLLGASSISSDKRDTMRRILPELAFPFPSRPAIRTAILKISARRDDSQYNSTRGKTLPPSVPSVASTGRRRSVDGTDPADRNCLLPGLSGLNTSVSAESKSMLIPYTPRKCPRCVFPASAALTSTPASARFDRGNGPACCRWGVRKQEEEPACAVC